jgi:fermentation-respiration switch protein FrsA (DUF1100 family)
MPVERRDVTLDSEGIPLVGAFFVPASPGPHPALVVCHGLPAGPAPAPGSPPPADDGLSYPDLATVCAERGLATLIFNFRGTGQSGGDYSPLGWARDLEAVLAWVWDRPEVDVDRIGVLGSSMGARVAIWVTARRPEVAALVSFAAPAQARWNASPQEMVERARAIGIIRDPAFPPSIEAWHQEMAVLDPLEAVARVAPRPLLLIHGEQDDVVSSDDARALYERAREPKELLMLPGVTHRFRREPAAIQHALDWLIERLGAEWR